MQASKLIFSLLLSLVLFVLLTSPLCAEVTNRIVATVNGDIITLHELNTSIKRLTGLTPKDLQRKDEREFYELRRAVLDEMINEKIAQQEIAKLELKVTARDVDESIERIKRENSMTHEELVKRLKAENTTLEQYRERIKKQIEQHRLVNYEVKSKVVVTEEEIRRFYNDNAEAYRQTHEVRLARILLNVRNQHDKDEIAQVRNSGRRILQELSEGGDFFELAQRYSQGPAASEGGNLGWIAFDQLERSLREVITGLSPGEYTDLHSAPSGFQIIKVMEERKAGIKPFEEVRDAIYSKLYKERVEKRFAEWIRELRDKSFIKVIF